MPSRHPMTDYPPCPAQTPRRAAAWAAARALLTTGPQPWPTVISAMIDAARPPLTPRSAGNLLAVACRAGGASWTGPWDTTRRTVHLGQVHGPQGTRTVLTGHRAWPERHGHDSHPRRPSVPQFAVDRVT